MHCPSALKSNRLIVSFFMLGVLSVSLIEDAYAQSDGEEKAEMLVRNFRNETITMEFSYVFRDYSWALMEREIDVDGDLIYKFPTNLPGCEYLIDWGIDDARLTISNARQVICSRDVSICEKRTITVDVRQQVCRTRVE